MRDNPDFEAGFPGIELLLLESGSRNYSPAAWSGIEQESIGMADRDVAVRDEYLELMKQCLTASLYDESAWQIVDGFRAGKSGLLHRFRRAFFQWLAGKGYRVLRTRPFDAQKRADGVDWPLFGYSMAGYKRLTNLEQCLRTILAENIPGDILETGVWRGGACIFMKALLNRFRDHSRTVWLADSFQGLPKPTEAADQIVAGHDLSDCDHLKVSMEQVRANFARFQLLDERVKFLKGWFCDTLPTAPIQQLSLLRLDGDLYESTRDALQAMYHRVAPGGFVIVDDYGTWSGCREAIDEFRGQKKIDAEITTVDHSCVFWRVPGSQRQHAAA